LVAPHPRTFVMVDPSVLSEFIALYHYERHLIPRYVNLCFLVWVLHDYFITLEDEVCKSLLRILILSSVPVCRLRSPIFGHKGAI
jgi:hypothetical protein